MFFLGPCNCKKEEAVGDDRVFGAVDAILTFEELGGWLKAEGITISECEEKPSLESGSEDQPHLSGWRRNCKVGDGTERDEGYISQTLRGRSGCLYGTI